MENNCIRAKKPEWWRRRIRELNIKAYKENMPKDEYLRKRARIFELWETKFKPLTEKEMIVKLNKLIK